MSAAGGACTASWVCTAVAGLSTVAVGACTSEGVSAAYVRLRCEKSNRWLYILSPESMKQPFGGGLKGGVLVEWGLVLPAVKDAKSFQRKKYSNTKNERPYWNLSIPSVAACTGKIIATKTIPIECRPIFVGKGQTERPRALGTLARALGVEATTALLGLALVVQGGYREDRHGSSSKFTGGPMMKSSAYAFSSSLIIRGLNSVCMPSVMWSISGRL